MNLKGKTGISILLLAFYFFVGSTVEVRAAYINYAEALQKSIYFYDAEKCGPGVTGGRLEWRGDCHTEDVFYGGFHDAGDHVKFGLPQSYTAATLAWGLYEFEDAFAQTGQKAHMVEILEYFADYFLRCWNGSRFVYQVGDGSIDHGYWGAPELQDPDDWPRPSYSTADGAASDQCAGAAAALTIMSLNGIRASECLTAAQQLYDLAVANRGLGFSGGYYNSSYDYDEMAWAAVWLYIATGNEDYLDDILHVEGDQYTGYISRIVASPDDDWQNIWVHCWDTVWGGVFAKLAPITDDSQHWWFFRWNCEFWSGGEIPHEESGDTNFIATTPAGFSWINGWGSARYNAAAQLQALVYTKETGDTRFADWARGQMEYIMGDNPMGRSYIVGYSDNYAEHPHHRAAHGSTTNSMDDPPEHRHTLWGALVGGPDMDDYHNDSTSDYIYNEVACDYNAGLVGALAGLYLQYGSGHQPVANFPPPEGDVDEYSMEAKVEQDSDSRTQVTVKVTAVPVHPPHYAYGVSARYFFDISELIDANQSIDDVSVELYYAGEGEGTPQLNGPFAWDGSIYYVDTDWSECPLYGSRELQFGLVAAQGPDYTTHWDSSNDWSMQGLSSEYSVTEYIPVYLDGTLVLGSEPGGGTTTTTSATTSTTTTAATTSTTTTAATTSTTTTAATTSTTTTAATTSTTTTSGGSCDCGTCDWYGTNVPMCCESCSGWGWYDGGCRRSCVCASSCPGSTTTTAATTSTTTTAATTSTTTTAATTSTTTTAATTSTTTTAATTSTTTTAATTSTTTTAATTSTTTTTAGAGCTCDSGCDGTSRSVPFTQNGSGTYCWQVSDSINYINSWSLSKLEINGVDYTNIWSNSMPARIDGVYYIYYEGSRPWSHFEAN